MPGHSPGAGRRRVHRHRDHVLLHQIRSSFYGPFREAAGTALKGDRKTYQMNPMNRAEAIRESLLDEAQGADCPMVKPAGAYLDILRDIRERTELPIGAYQVSGEYAMIKFAAQAGAIAEEKVVLESSAPSNARAPTSSSATSPSIWLRKNPALIDVARRKRSMLDSGYSRRRYA